MSYDQKITLGGLFDIGLSARREVLGAAYVDKSMQSTNDFMMAFQHITTEWCWGYAWNRPGLDRKTRSRQASTAICSVPTSTLSRARINPSATPPANT